MRWNDFGGNFGGPVYFGRYNKDKNKTFFFYSEEVRRIIQYVTFNPTWPTMGMTQGNLLQPVCLTSITTAGIVCPSGSAPVTRIPTSLFNPNAVRLSQGHLQQAAAAQRATIAATTSSVLFRTARCSTSARNCSRSISDSAISSRCGASSKTTHIPTVEPVGLFSCNTAAPLVCTTHTNAPGKAYVFHVQNLIRPNIINDAGFNFTQRNILSIPAGVTTKANAPDINPTEPFANTQGVVPNLSFTGGSTLNGYGPYNDYNNNWNFLRQSQLD